MSLVTKGFGLAVLLASVGTAGGCGAEASAVSEFVLPNECDTSSGVSDCTRLAFDEIARLGMGRALEIQLAAELPGRIIEVIQEAAERGAGPLDLMLLVDGTGSMDAEIDAIQARADDLIEAALENGGAGTRVGLTLYRDQCTDRGQWLRFVDLSDDMAFVRSVIAGASALGGGDIPESIHEAIWETATRATWANPTRIIVIVGDSHPHTGDECESVTLKEAVAVTTEKGVTIFTVVVPLFPTRAG